MRKMQSRSLADLVRKTEQLRRNWATHRSAGI